MIPKKPNNVIWSDEQWEAIHLDGSNILVSAGAGSGKTAVLSPFVSTRIYWVNIIYYFRELLFKKAIFLTAIFVVKMNKKQGNIFTR